ncbi:hypothetical protein KSP35_21075 [Aquihabitans sp. G128]|uniref:SecDF P1 head subdomain-containing protein n=1 Tax=Aquihabitans sp. G128 TaxID=2849779 RepID=UPI001C21852C|nr:hypothetical protein [Aquihabitans sp. G128]QXC60786.1 hypothetical protein KSP35_21075 [Aquihabitans sp. G128]
MGISKVMAAAGLVAVLAAGCSSGGSSDRDPGSTTTSGRSSTSTSTTSSTTSSTTTTSTPPESETTIAAQKIQLDFRPVLAVGAPVNGTCDSVGDAGDRLLSEDGALCYAVGPVGFTGEDLATAEATLQNEWSVAVTVRRSKIDQANDTFNACYQGGATCPAPSSYEHGAIAIVVDGKVLSAPAVNGPDLASETFTITGNLTRDSATTLAHSLGG